MSILPHAATTNPKKRKRQEISHDALHRPFTIRPYPSSAYDKPHTFTPIQLLPRSKLPLSLLDPTTSLSDLICNRLFSAHIAALEGEGDPDAPVVLIAATSSPNTLFAVERVQDGVYALCKLANWVTVEVVQDLVSLPQHDSYCLHKVAPVRGTGHEYWQQASLGSLPPSKPIGSHGELPRISMARPAAVDPKPVSQTAIIHPSASPAVQQRSRTPTEPVAEQGLPRLTAAELFENFVSQYLEALYLSKASLAYFAKGPISRVRASFAGSQDGSFQLSELAIFYRSILHSTTSIDKKYKEKLPELIKGMPMAFCSDEEPMTSATVRRKKTTTRKLKPSKDGMYSDEAEYVRKWWLSDWAIPSQRDFGSAEDVARKRTANLKVRETLAQLIVAMEVMALESLPACQLPQMVDDPGGVESQAPRTTDAVSQKKRKSKKPQDMSSIMDVLVERLCIWQSVEQEESSAKLPSRNQASENTHITAGGASNSDILKDFCVEVIIPFYMNRIPDKAASINRKLGGPGAPSPAKPTAIQSTSTTATLRKPGEPEVRQPPPKKVRRPLQKVSSEVNPTSRRPPSLARSATDSGIVPGLKREGSEIPLLAIPRQESQIRRGGSLADIKRFRQREIDLTAMTAANEAKQRKKAAVENELKTAISALKKPNRGLAVKELVDSADQRRLQSGVQVTATPKRASKSKNITQSKPALRSPPPNTADGPAPRSSGACIPSSTIRPAASFLFPGTERRESRTGLHTTVAETPSRGPAKTVSFFTDPIPQTPSRNQKRAAVFSTPVKPFAAPYGIVAATPTSNKLNAVETVAEESIYDALGWDDDGDLG